MPDGNFQDYVVLSQDTLSHRGASVQIGTTSVSTVGIGLSNSAGMLALEAVPTGNGTVFFPTSGGTLLTNINVSAGTTSNNLSAVTFSNANGVSFGLNGSVVTASVAAEGVDFGGIAAGTQTATSGTVIFSNSNGVTFGMSGSLTVTASVASSLTNINVSAGTTSNNLSAITFSNSNGVSFGLNASTVTASVATSLTNINVSAGTTSNNLSAITFSNSNGVSFGLNGSTLTGSIATSLTAINVSAGTTSNNLSAVTFSNANNVSFGLNGSVVTASATIAQSEGSATMMSDAADFVTNFQISQATLSLKRTNFGLFLSATQMGFIADVEGSTNSSGAFTVSHGVYTMNAGTASLASSGSRQVSWSSGSATSASSQYGGVSGTRYRTMGVNYSFTPGDYLFAWYVSTSNSPTVNLFGQAAMSFVGTFDGFETSAFLNGTSNSSVTALPSSIVATNTNYARTGAPAMRQPGAIFVGTGSN